MPVDQVEYRGQFPLEVTVVPARAAYLVREDSRGGFRRAVQEASTRWAGVTEPIVPVQLGGVVEDWVRKVVEFARVDGAVNVDLPDEEARVVAAALGLECVRITDIDRWGITLFTCHPGLVGPPALPGAPPLVIAGPSDELWQIVAAGDLTVGHLADLDPAILPVRRGLTPDDVGRAQLGNTTLLSRTLVSFGETVGSQAPFPTSTIVWVTESNGLRDCWDFWNARTLRPVRFGPMPMILLPRGQIQHWLGFDKQFEHILRRPAGFTPDVLITSTNVSVADLDEIAALLHLERTDEEIKRGHVYPASVRAAPFTYRAVRNLGPLLAFKRSYGTCVSVDIHIFNNDATVRFPSPVQFRAGNTLLRFGGTPFNGLPRRPAVAKLVDPSAIWRGDAIQICTMASEQYAFQLHVPSLRQATSALLGEATSGYQPSNDGSLAVGIQKNIDIAVLREPGVFQAIRQLTTPRTKHFLNEVRRQFKGGDDIENIIEKLKPLADHWGGRTGQRMRSASDLNGGATVGNIAALERLCGLGWVERGLRITCTDCHIDSFTPLNDVAFRSSTTCRGCGSEQEYVRGDAGVSIFYRLNSLVDRASDQGVIPHLLVIAELNRRSPQSWFFPGLNLYFSDDIEKEADIVGVYEGRLVVGEVKVSGTEFNDGKIADRVELCTRLGADIFIMAATDNIPDKSQETARGLCDNSHLDLIVLTGSDLFPGS